MDRYKPLLYGPRYGKYKGLSPDIIAKNSNGNWQIVDFKTTPDLGKQINHYIRGMNMLYPTQLNPDQLIKKTKKEIIKELTICRLKMLKDQEAYVLYMKRSDIEIQKLNNIITGLKKNNQQLQNIMDSIANLVENGEILLGSGK